MVGVNSPFDASITPYIITSADYRVIGRLVRACAELENIIDYYVCDRLNIDYPRLLLIAGKMGAASKLKLVERLKKIMDDESKAAYQDCFEKSQYKEVVIVRNAVAHGNHLGQTPDGIAFQISDIADVTSDEAMVTIRSILPRDLRRYADIAEALIPQFETLLRVPASRRKPPQPARAHPKGRIPSQQSARAARPPRSSHQ